LPDDSPRPYFRRDRSAGITPPDLAKTATYAEHIVRARGKRTQFTSVSLDAAKVRDFGDMLYRLKRDVLVKDAHGLVEHEALLQSLQQTIQASDKAERVRAIQAVRYARRRLEGLVEWRFNVAAVPPKDLIGWAAKYVGAYFAGG
jgi:hypothetical protein